MRLECKPIRREKVFNTQYGRSKSIILFLIFIISLCFLILGYLTVKTVKSNKLIKSPPVKLAPAKAILVVSGKPVVAVAPVTVIPAVVSKAQVKAKSALSIKDKDAKKKVMVKVIVTSFMPLPIPSESPSTKSKQSLQVQQQPVEKIVKKTGKKIITVVDSVVDSDRGKPLPLVEAQVEAKKTTELKQLLQKLQQSELEKQILKMQSVKSVGKMQGLPESELQLESKPDPAQVQGQLKAQPVPGQLGTEKEVVARSDDPIIIISNPTERRTRVNEVAAE